MKWLTCLLRGHAWIYGRVAASDVRRVVKGWPCYHDRECSRCGKQDMAATRAERECARIQRVSERLLSTRGKLAEDLEKLAEDHEAG